MLTPARDRPWRPRQQRVERESLATGTVAEVVGVGGPADDTSRPATVPDRAAVDAVRLGGTGPVDGASRPAVDPDRAAVDEARSGDVAAFEGLVVKYQTRLVNFAAALVADAGAGEDVAQEALVRAWRGLGRFRGESSFKTWLYRIATNVARTHRERRGRQPVIGRSLEDEAEARPGSEPVAPAADAETALVTRETIDRALGELPEELRLALVLRDVEGLDYKEIASVTAAPIGTVESRIFRARRRMRALLQPCETADGGARRRPARTGPGRDR
ncbi:MAG: sigma-70 family RNA polymerase sigma factor [Acidobacteria bacterium]|nr:sigma-70 family RNA polymerase sigma factor [Acidobacteriota bacterium]